MAKEEQRQPLSFWGTVGANVVGGLLTGVATAGIAAVIVGVSIARMSSRVDALAGAVGQPPLPPAGGG